MSFEVSPRAAPLSLAHSATSVPQEWIALFSQVLPCYAGDEDLIPDAAMRKKLTRIHRDLHLFFRELHTPCYRTEAEIKELESLAGSLRTQMCWFQDHVERDGTGLGHLFDCPKGHDFLDMVEVLKDLGWVLHASAGVWEATNRSLRTTDELTRRDMLRGGHASELLRRHGVAERNAATAPPQRNASSQRRRPPEWPRVHRVESLAPNAKEWTERRLVLRNGRLGVPVPESVLADLPERLVTHIEATEASLLSPGRVVHLGQRLQLAEGAGHQLEAGNGLRLADKRLAQLLLIVVDPSRSRVRLFAQVFVRAATREKHPEAGMPWLQRAPEFVLVPAGPAVRREHIQELYGRAYQPRQQNEAQFLWNRGIFHAKKDRAHKHEVFCLCPATPGCEGRVQCPDREGDRVTCPTCGASFPWQ